MVEGQTTTTYISLKGCISVVAGCCRLLSSEFWVYYDLILTVTPMLAGSLPTTRP